MARTKNRTKYASTSPIVAGAKALKLSADFVQHVGPEPVWEDITLTEENRKHYMINGFNWYNYCFTSKEAIDFVVEYLNVQKRKDEAKQVKRAPELSFPNAIGWLARMSMMGWELTEEEEQRIEDAIKKAIASVPVKVVVDNTEENKVNKPTIQDRMREKCAETGGELEGMLDEYIAKGAPTKHSYKPINILKSANILPGHVKDEVAHWEKMRDEFQKAYEGKDADLVEAYSQFGKIQLRNLVKFCDLIISDYHGYVAFKKANKKVRKRKVKTPRELVRKLKYMPEFKDLGLTSVKPEKIVGAKEMFVYDTKKRKLMYFVADDHAGELTVRNNIIEGFDKMKSIQKTVRKPAEQLKEFMKASKPGSRKFFKAMKSVEQKFSGRFNDNIVILKVW